MILGMGSDLVDTRRIERILELYGERFAARLFTSEERTLAARRDAPALTYAKRFAAKEACAKALGTGIRAGVFFRDMGVVNLPSGQPTLRLTGGALTRLQRLVPSGLRPVLHLTLTDEPPLAQALVIIEGVEEGV